MRKKLVLCGCLAAAAMMLSGCQPLTGTQKETEKITETETQKKAAAETETEKETEKEIEPETEEETVAENIAAAGDTAEAGGTAQTQPMQETVSEGNASENVSAQQYEEEMMQCPYCAHWFSTISDGVSGSPYDLHMAEERANDPAGGTTEQEMVQCPDCGNWYESGNIFRNHICEGREQQQ